MCLETAAGAYAYTAGGATACAAPARGATALFVSAYADGDALGVLLHLGFWVVHDAGLLDGRGVYLRLAKHLLAVGDDLEATEVTQVYHQPVEQGIIDDLCERSDGVAHIALGEGGALHDLVLHGAERHTPLHLLLCTVDRLVFVLAKIGFLGLYRKSQHNRLVLNH